MVIVMNITNTGFVSYWVQLVVLPQLNPRPGKEEYYNGEAAMLPRLYDEPHEESEDEPGIRIILDYMHIKYIFWVE